MQTAAAQTSQADAGVTGTANLFVGSYGAEARAGASGNAAAQRGPLRLQAAGDAARIGASENIDASRLGRLLPESISLGFGATQAALQVAGTLLRPRYVVAIGVNGALPGLAVND